MLDLKKIFSKEGIVDPVISSPRFSPDGNRCTFLKGKEESPKVFDLWEVDLKTGKQHRLVDSSDLQDANAELSKEEKDRRERLRLFAMGIVSYQWSPNSKMILFPIAGRLYTWDAGTRLVKALNDKATNMMDPKFSAKSSFVTFTENQNVRKIDLATGEMRELTTEGHGNIKCGEAEFVVQEELSRYDGYWVSPDETTLAYEVYDESPVELVTRNEIFADRVDIIEQRYPYAGEANVTYKLVLKNLESGETVAAQIDTLDNYLARVTWSPDSKFVYAQVLNRLQNGLTLYKIDKDTGVSTAVLTESADPWVNINDIFRISSDGSTFIWGSERSDLRQVYLYDTNGKLLKQLTQTDTFIDSVVYWDNEELVYTAFTDMALNRKVFRKDLTSSETKVLAGDDGMNSVILNKSKTHYLIEQNDLTTPQKVSLVCLERNERFDVHSAACSVDGVDLNDMFDKPEYGSFKSKDGEVELNYRIIFPHNFDPSKSYPAIVHLYGGPHAQMVTKGWTGDRYLFQQYLASQGFLIISVDNRGSANRGLSFEGAVHEKMSEFEVQDQASAAEFLKARPYVDSSRFGVHGWSYGGYMTLMCMFRKADIFKVGVSGAPVTDWKLYDTCYTERYMSTPQLNPEGYEKASVFPYVDGLEGKLLLIHGMADDNVLFTNSTMLYSALHQAEKMFDVMVYPGEKHAIAGNVSKIHNYQSIANYFINNL
jgi:dipeptidyl-peptidase 4